MYQQLAAVKLLGSLLKRFRSYKKQIDLMLPKLECGTLQCWESGEKTKYYHNIAHGGKRTRVTVDPNWGGSRQLVEDLTVKKILIDADDLVKQDIEILEKFIDQFKVCDPVSIRRSLSRAYRSGNVSIAKTFMNGDIDPAAWRKEAYVKNTSYQNELVYKTITGEMTRSKSEAMIYDALIKRGTAFRYDCVLSLEMCDPRGRLRGRRTVSPDFIMLRESDRRLIVYEHFGKMDDPKYVKRTMQKLKDYSDAGYHLGSNFIFTCEDLDDPFTAVDAAKILDMYLGPRPGTTPAPSPSPLR